MCARLDSLEEGGEKKAKGGDDDDPGKPVPVIDSYAAQRGLAETKAMRAELERKEAEVARMMEKINARPLSQRQHQELADAQARADAAYQSWGRRRRSADP